MSDALHRELMALDAWCKARADKVALQGVQERDPEKRQRLLGEHRAFLRMRSFIHGSRLSPGKKDN